MDHVCSQDQTSAQTLDQPQPQPDERNQNQAPTPHCPTYPYTHLINTKATVTDEETGEDIEIDLPVYVCVAKKTPVFGPRFPLLPQAYQTQNPRVNQPWRSAEFTRAPQSTITQSTASKSGTAQESLQRTEQGKSSTASLVTASVPPWRRGKGRTLRGTLRGSGRGRWTNADVDRWEPGVESCNEEEEVSRDWTVEGGDSEEQLSEAMEQEAADMSSSQVKKEVSE